MTTRPTRRLVLAAFVLFSVVAVVITVALSSGSPEPEEEPPARSGIDLERRIADFADRLTEDGGYRGPLRSERNIVAEGVALLIEGHRKDAERRLAEVDFGVRTLTDESTGRRYAEVADAPEAEVRRGWGRVYVALGRPVGWSVQVPHPAADRDSERLGIGMLRKAEGGVLVLAGAHRRAGRHGEADVSHRRDTVFHAVCAELAARKLPGIQLHGFADDSEPDHDVVVSSGAGHEGRPDARQLARALADERLDVCRAWVRHCTNAGRGNVQGRTADYRDVPFLHVEFSRSVRKSPARIARAVTALTRTAATWMHKE
jgi:hypothetical protein